MEEYIRENRPVYTWYKLSIDDNMTQIDIGADSSGDGVPPKAAPAGRLAVSRLGPDGAVRAINCAAGSCVQELLHASAA